MTENKYQNFNEKCIISIDGNNTGKLLERCIFTDDVQAVSRFSNYMLQAVEKIKNHVEGLDGTVYAAGGDNVIAEVNMDDVKNILQITKSCETDEVSFSVGIGNSVLNAYMALKYAKSIKSSHPIIYDGIRFTDLQ